jgi:hypothetical protein
MARGILHDVPDQHDFIFGSGLEYHRRLGEERRDGEKLSIFTADRY